MADSMTISYHRNLEFSNINGKKLLLDLYIPEDASSDKIPVIVWIFGGAWLRGNKESCPIVRMVHRGYAVAAISYRMSHEAIFPAQLQDCKTAIRWLRAHAEYYNLDSDSIGAWGASSGGHLAAFLGTAGNVSEFEGEGNLEFSSEVQAVCDWFGTTDFLQMDTAGSDMVHNAPDSPESLLIGGPITEYKDLAARANPINYISASGPPFLIMHGDNDRLVPLHQSELLYEALQKVKADVTFLTFKGVGHVNFDGPEYEPIIDEFFDKHLKKM
jgi:acetyl esterase/lipase